MVTPIVVAAMLCIRVYVCFRINRKSIVPAVLEINVTVCVMDEHKVGNITVSW